MRGAGAYARIAKNTGDWFGELQTNIRTPGYETNDYAFQQRADYIWFNGNIGRHWTKPTSWYRQIYAIAGGQNQNNFEGDARSGNCTRTSRRRRRSSGTSRLFYIHRPAVIDDRALRGGPAVIGADEPLRGARHLERLAVRSSSGTAAWAYYWDDVAAA